MFKLLITLCIYFNLLIYTTYGQDCIAYGKQCSDFGQCCGGCCIDGHCIDTYEHCYELRDPCWDHYCPNGMSCQTFKPEDCPECEVQAVCS